MEVNGLSQCKDIGDVFDEISNALILESQREGHNKGLIASAGVYLATAAFDPECMILIKAKALDYLKKC